MTSSSTASVRAAPPFSLRPHRTDAWPDVGRGAPGLVMSAGGSKWVWCKSRPVPSRAPPPINPPSPRARPPRRHHRAYLPSPASPAPLLTAETAQLAVGVILLWGATIYEQFGLLAGRSAPPEFLQLVLYKALTFSDEIEQIDTVRAYHVSLPSPSLHSLYVLSYAADARRRAGRSTSWRWTW